MNKIEESEIWGIILALEDSLQEAGIFRNMFCGDITCHSDSYGTLVCYQRLENWYKTQTIFSIEEIKAGIEYWSNNENMQPPLRQVASFLKRKIGA